MRRWLAGLRLALIYALLCAVVLAAGLGWRGLLAAGWGLKPATPASPALSQRGINVEMERLGAEGRDRQLRALAEQDFDWVRQRFDWASLEPNPGLHDWSVSDGVIGAFGEYGLDVVAVLDGSPAWARATRDGTPNDNPLAPPAKLQDFARFAGEFAARYGPHVRYYQIWDEANIAPHWGDRHIDPVGYAQLLRAAAAAIRAADPDAVILTAALAPTQDRGHTAMDEVYFLQRMYAAGAAPAFDVVAIQPFGFGRSPDDPAQRRDVLNFARAAWVRRAVQAAGDGATPLWAVRYGWNRAPNAVWGSVSPADQAGYAVGAQQRAGTEWPWLQGMAWAVAVPHAPEGDARWGFALTPPLAAAIQAGASEAASGDGGAAAAARNGRQRALIELSLLALAGTALLWRGVAASRLLPWAQWRAALRRTSPAVMAALWGGLGAVYISATWPPLIGLCWLAAFLLTLARPRGALWLTLALLPFYFQHKELALVNRTLTVPPAHALTLCLGLVLVVRYRRGPAHRPVRVHPADWLAGAWLIVNLAAALRVWHWPAYGRGFIDLALIPVLLYAAVRTWTRTPADLRRAATALFAGGALVAAAGVLSWLQGSGTAVDGLRRLVGPHFSPNHTALYLARSLFVGIGLVMGLRGAIRWLVGFTTTLIGLALLLTASRGALLLGVPAGLLTLILLVGVDLRRASPRRWIAAGAGLAALGAAGLILGWSRLANRATILERIAIWRSTLALWQDHLMTGVGPGGFFWRYPAYIPLGAPMDPNLRHPHNVWLETGAAAGLLGLLWLGALFVLLAWMVRRLWRAGRAARGANPATSRAVAWSTTAGVAAGLAAGLAHGQVDAFGALADLAAWNWAAVGLITAWFIWVNSTPTAPVLDKDVDQKEAVSPQ